MFSITAGTKFAFTVDAKTNPQSGIAVAVTDSNAEGWFQATATDGQEWFLNVAHVTAASRPGFAMSYPLLHEDGVVMNGHVEYCAVEGHATRHIDGVLQDRCPRCGNMPNYSSPEHGAPTTELSAWRVADVPAADEALEVAEDAAPAVGCRHFLAHGLSESYACGADAVGRRSSDQQDPSNTNCRDCRQTDAWQDAVV